MGAGHPAHGRGCSTPGGQTGDRPRSSPLPALLTSLSSLATSFRSPRTNSKSSTIILICSFTFVLEAAGGPSDGDEEEDAVPLDWADILRDSPAQPGWGGTQVRRAAWPRPSASQSCRSRRRRRRPPARASRSAEGAALRRAPPGGRAVQLPSALGSGAGLSCNPPRLRLAPPAPPPGPGPARSAPSPERERGRSARRRVTPAASPPPRSRSGRGCRLLRKRRSFPRRCPKCAWLHQLADAGRGARAPVPLERSASPEQCSVGKRFSRHRSSPRARR